MCLLHVSYFSICRCRCKQHLSAQLLVDWTAWDRNIPSHIALSGFFQVKQGFGPFVIYTGVWMNASKLYSLSKSYKWGMFVWLFVTCFLLHILMRGPLFCNHNNVFMLGFTSKQMNSTTFAIHFCKAIVSFFLTNQIAFLHVYMLMLPLICSRDVTN